MGSATAWHLARRGREVTLLERFGERADEIRAILDSPNGWGAAVDGFVAVVDQVA